ncbi:prepilin-type N-terminal cleavage/methylation domain-containing protein [Legionella taurinensis]|uniref:Prepilin-type N-terminal cleavage/methylation domain-containing protein n=1 Tax=Legionella taurinensis TaxID=70611 RepID=A0A3A5L9U1_9GAMM|nr:type II secretion system protein [Legionella taurinensis]MDX1837318.1 prepilin-type N-terminal cleavage/methylation domain-containing protein [Legionella taurinensis]PUT40674.1 hypothetical protein DB744_05235 [Legionella taurinensis]PUT44096.1 hypothetical protein DB746_03635 [Legionella taurinensis]PUT47397.1 hypothetical protein DB743_01805 [Legionella taurinensis]PUT48536.1 hypothetical protein DB745_03635 [Legionella taurinensis]
MTSSQGFSLIEVLITLLVILSTSFGLLTQQWQSLCLFNQAKAQFSECLTSDNEYELRLAGLKPFPSLEGGKK